MFLEENRGFQFVGTHCRMPLPLICMCWSHSLHWELCLNFSPLFGQLQRKRAPGKLWSFLPNFHLAPAKLNNCSYSVTGLPWHNFKLKSEKLLLTWQQGDLPCSKSEIRLQIHRFLSIYCIFGITICILIFTPSSLFELGTKPQTDPATFKSEPNSVEFFITTVSSF